jgi:hypothetical protein
VLESGVPVAPAATGSSKNVGMTLVMLFEVFTVDFMWSRWTVVAVPLLKVRNGMVTVSPEI